VIATARQMMGKTNPADALPGTIRGDFGVNVAMNIVHGSDSPESAARELALWFGDEEIVPYDKTIERWI
jgi:nucleoside-diphosphate kinase